MMVRFDDYDQVCLITHGRTFTPTQHEVGHFDDWLVMAVGAYLRRWSARRIKRVDDVDYVRSQLSREPNVLNVIADFIYNPAPDEQNVLVFDHHDPATNTGKCSVHLLMEALHSQGLLKEVPVLMGQISLWDVVGPQAVPPEDRPDQDKYMALLAAEPENGFDFKTASFILAMLERSFSIRQFVEEIFNSETGLGENARRIYSEILSQREKALDKIVKTAAVLESPTGIRYAIIHENPAGLTNDLFSRLKVDILIHPNERTLGALSVVRNSNGKYAETPVAELVEVHPKQIAFRHPGGSLLVIYPVVVK